MVHAEKNGYREPEARMEADRGRQKQVGKLRLDVAGNRGCGSFEKNLSLALLCLTDDFSEVAMWVLRSRSQFYSLSPL